MYQRLTCNLVGAQKRYETLNGRRHLVVPAVMLKEGVWCGDQGPLYYPPDELGRNIGTWNHKPLVIYHPTLNGNGITACDPAVLERQGVGMMLNTLYNDKLRTEAWFDEAKLKQVDPRVHEAIQNNRPVEVSTGLFHEADKLPGEWNGKKYTGTVRNIQGDHLAILPDLIGAMSVADGGGLLQNAKHDLGHNDVEDHIHQELNGHEDEYNSPLPYSKRAHVKDVMPEHVVYEKEGKHYRHEYKVKDGKAKLHGEPEEVHRQTVYTTTNGLLLNEPIQAIVEPSEVMKRQQMQTALATKYGGLEDTWGGWVQEISANFVIWYKDGKLFRLPYTYADSKIKFAEGTAEEVERISEYKAKKEPIHDGTLSPGTNQEKPVAIAAPTKNADGAPPVPAPNPTKPSGRTEVMDKIKAWLEAQSDELLGKVAADIETAFKAIGIPPYTYAGIGDRSSVHSAMNQGTPMTINQYLEQAPPELREVLNEAIATAGEEKARLVEQITSNASNVFSKEWLQRRPVAELRGLAALAGGRAPTRSYAGQADVPMFIAPVAPPAQNQTQKPLPVPVWNWDKSA